MARKRKRPTKNPPTNSRLLNHGRQEEEEEDKRLGGSTHHPVLSLYFPQVVTLRTYLYEQLPLSSKSRRRKVASLGLEKQARCDHAPNSLSCQQVDAGARRTNEEIQALAGILDSTLVGILKEPDGAIRSSRQKEFAAFTQSQARSSLECTDIGATTSQSDIVDFAIFSLFNRSRDSIYRPPHLLCHGFQRATNQCAPNQEHDALAGIRGIVPQYPNKNVSTLKNPPWTDVLGLLGKSCEEIMLHLLLDCCIFIQVDEKKGSFYQLSGIQLSELKLLNSRPQANLAQATTGQAPKNGAAKPPRLADDILHTPATITFVRSRMLYARAALNAKGTVRFGLRHIHVLNRYPDSTNWDHTLHIMKYVFPRQFGLHNVFTSCVNPKETIQKFKDYTLREDEIARRRKQNHGLRKGPETPVEIPEKVPKRLRGDLVGLIQKLQKRHQQCPYAELLRYYCPVESLNQTQTIGSESDHSRLSQSKVASSKLPMTDYATPPAAVSAFSRAVLLKLIPNELYGYGEDGMKNRDIIMRHVDSFVQLRRFESLSLHEVSQGLKITCVKWLQPPSGNKIQELPSTRLSPSDIRKRTEIFLEFIYYIFDSILIPLIRSNFYVTESGVHRNRLFYFRHDIWRQLAEPSIAQLKLSTFEEVKKETAEQILSGRNLGYSFLRLLPKSSGARPIVNLRRRPVRRCGWGGLSELGPSINTLMTPAFNVLNYEKTQRLGMLGATMFSVGEMYARLKAFKERQVLTKVARTKPFYFVKLDIKSCFDTIPQERLIRLAERLVAEDEYLVTKHVEIRPPEEPLKTNPDDHQTKVKP
ncbi:hypothetical protein ACJ72_07921, partial [Emergomyces africanus]